jgi:hypothetical protein
LSDLESFAAQEEVASLLEKAEQASSLQYPSNPLSTAVTGVCHIDVENKKVGSVRKSKRVKKYGKTSEN